MAGSLPTELDELRHVQHVEVEIATGIDAALMAVLPRRLFRDRVARMIWDQKGRPALASLEHEPVTFKLPCQGDPNLYEVWVNVKGRAYARHFVKRAKLP